METVTIKRTNRSPSIAATLMQAGSVIDLTGSAVKLIARSRRTGSVEFDAAAVIVVAAAGTVRYDFAIGDVDTADEYDIEWEVTLPSAQTVTVPNDGYDRLRILDDLRT